MTITNNDKNDDDNDDDKITKMEKINKYLKENDVNSHLIEKWKLFINDTKMDSDSIKYDMENDGGNNDNDDNDNNSNIFTFW